MGSSSADSKLFTTVTLENIQQVTSALHPNTYYIITAESGYCPACHSDLSSANITAPNSLLGHLRRSKKCIAKREERKIQLLGLKQPDSLLWGSVDDLAALDSRRCPNRDVWVSQVFPPTRPQQGASMVNMSQWQARQSSPQDYYPSSSPSPSSSSSDDGYSSGWGSSSSSNGSPTSSHFHHQYVSPQDYLAYSDRRGSGATISGKDYYAKTQPQYAMPPASYQTPPAAYGTGLGMGIGQQYRMQQQPQYAPQAYPQQQMPQMQYAPAPAGYMQPQQQPWAGY